MTNDTPAKLMCNYEHVFLHRSLSSKFEVLTPLKKMEVTSPALHGLHRFCKGLGSCKFINSSWESS